MGPGGQHAGRTDVPLTDAGVGAGKALAPALARRRLVAAFSSPLSRAMRSASRWPRKPDLTVEWATAATRA